MTLSFTTLSFDLEEFDRIAYSYRIWPRNDPQGVADRFQELVEYVEEQIQAQKKSQFFKPKGEIK